MNDINETKEMKMNKQQIQDAIESLQIWFASKPYGWRETATQGQIQQWDDRVREEEGLIARLEMMS